MVYVSCDPGTLARDIKLLGELGYEFVEAFPVDMFVATMHVECIALIQSEIVKSPFKQLYKYFVFVEDGDGGRKKS